MRFVILIVIVLLAVFAGLFFINASQPKVSAQENAVPVAVAKTSTRNVIVANIDIPAGAMLNQDMVRVQPWPSDLAISSFVISDAEKPFDVNGMVARADFKEGQPLQSNLLARQDEAGFLAANMPAGARAVTLAVDSISGVAGYIFPGDHVDVVVTHNIPQEGPQQLGLKKGGDMRLSNDSRPTTSEVLLPNVRVLALNTRPARTQGRDSNNSQQIAVQEPSPDPSNITLQLSQDEVKKLRLAEKNGTLSLALRSMKDSEDASVGVPVTLLDLSRVEMGGKKPAGNEDEVKKGVVIVRGVVVENPAPAMEAAPGAYPAMAR